MVFFCLFLWRPFNITVMLVEIFRIVDTSGRNVNRRMALNEKKKKYVFHSGLEANTNANVRNI